MALGTRAAGILEEIARQIGLGRPEEVAERIAEGRLDMRPEAVAERRSDFTGLSNPPTYYKGGGERNRAPLIELEDRSKAFFATPDPMLANSYVEGAGMVETGAVYPLNIDTRDFATVDARGQSYQDIFRPTLFDAEGYTLIDSGRMVDPRITNGYDDSQFPYSTDHLAAAARRADIPGVLISNVVDLGSNYGSLDRAMQQTEGLRASDYIRRLDEQGAGVVAVNPDAGDGMNKVRSLFAAFDPEYKGSNILGGTAAGALGLTALMAPEEAEAKTPEFLESLPQLEPYEPGLIDSAVQSVAEFLKDVGATESNYTANQMASSLSDLADFTPVVGDAKGFAETRDLIEEGNYGQAAVSGLLAALGLIPVGGDIAAAALKGALPLGAMRAREGDPQRLIELGYLTPDSATNPSAVKSAITKYEKNLKQSKGFAFRENLAAQNDALTSRQLDQFEPSIVTPEQIAQGNYVLMPVMGDPSAIGLVDMVGGVPLADQVAIEGGVDFAQKFGTGTEGVAWASNLGAAKPQFKKYRDIANLTGRQPLVAYAKMLDDSSNFATGPAEIMMQQMPSLKIAKADKKKFDDELRAQYKDWPGLDSPQAMDWVMGRGDFPNIGKRRTAFTTIMAKSDYRDRGFPVYNEAIEAVLKPELIGDERYQSGFSLFTPDLDRDIFAFEGHKSYDTAMPGQFFGNLEQTVPMELMYPRAVQKNLQRMTNPKDPIKNPPRPFSLDEAKNAVITGTDKYSPVFEIPDQYWLDGLLSAIGR